MGPAKPVEPLASDRVAVLRTLGAETPSFGTELDLAAKLTTPPPRPGAIPRARLLDRLAECTRRKLTTISAPAGFGKSTLLAEWSASPAARVHPIAWLSIEPSDDEPARFLGLLAAALGRAIPGAGAEALSRLRAAPGAQVRAVVAALFSGLPGSERDVVLVLDDYHLVQSAPIHEAIAFALDRLPAGVHLVIAARTLPRLPLARLRARGDLLEIRAADLRFTVEEATAFLEGAAGLRLSPGAAESLAARTEGWVTGLQLAALSAQGCENPESLLAAFTGSQRLVFDFLRDEVLEHEPAEVQEFLLCTSILEGLCGPLCDAVMNTGGSAGRRRHQRAGPPANGGAGQRILERLERANLFLVPLDEERRWWRYHRLFAQFLQRRLEEEHRGKMDALHRRAALWLGENGFAVEAAGHAIAARDHEWAASLLEEAGQRTCCPRQAGAWLGRLRDLPRDMALRPSLHLTEAWALAGAGQVQAAEARLREATEAAPLDRVAEAEARVLSGFMAAMQGKGRRAVQLSSHALRRLPRGRASARAFAHFSLGLAHESLGNCEAARNDFRRARALVDAGAEGVAPFLATARLGCIELARGSLREAARLFEEGVRLASWAGDRAPGVGWPQTGLGGICYQWDDLESAARQFGAAIELGSRSDMADVPILAYAELAHVRQSQGDATAARRLALRSEEFIRGGAVISPWSVNMARALHARLWMRQRDVDSAARWAESRSKGDEGILHEDRHMGNAVWARVMLGLGRPNDVVEPLQRWLRAARSAGNRGQALELQVLWSHALATRGDARAAHAALGEALAQAQPEGWIRVFLDEGEPMARLLERAARGRSGTAGYARGLLAALARSGGWQVTHVAAAGPIRGEVLVTPLGKREREILALIADGLSNSEIAERLVITTATVKTHINNLYGKLGARSRIDAINRARRVGLGP
jgi:LuxR family maltose regulon positive regulatory protein